MGSDERADARLDPSFDFDLGTLRMYIGGEWLVSESGETFAAHSPATGGEIAQVPLGTRRDARRAIEAACGAAGKMRRMTAWEKSELCVNVAEVFSRRIYQSLLGFSREERDSTNQVCALDVWLGT